MSRALIAAVVLLALLSVAAWLVVSPGRTAVPLAPGAAVAPDIDAPRAAAELADVEVEAASSTIAPAQVADERKAALSANEEELARAQWVEGRVQFPAGTPLDEEAFVVADGRDFGDGRDHRARVAPDGRFRVAFSEKSRTGLLRLEARYLFLEEPRRWRQRDRDPIVLEPRLGGRIEVRLLPPSGIAPSELGGRAQLWGRQPGPIVFGAGVVNRERSPDEEGRFVIDALDAGADYYLEYEGPRFVVDDLNVSVAAGVTSRFELAARTGLVVQGRVVGEDGAPLERVDVNLNVRTPGGEHQHRSTQSAADGTWRLSAVSSGRLDLGLRLAGFEPFEESREPPSDGGRLEFESVLRRGHSIAGRVSWPDGTPAAAALILTPHRVDATDEGGPVEARASADGSFSASGLSSKAYHVRASSTHVAQVPSVSAVTGRERMRKERALWSAEIERVDVGTTDLELVLGAGLSVRGVVRDAQGAPLDDVRVSSRRLSFPGGGWDPQAGPNDRFRSADGSFELTGFQPGRWALLANARGYVESEPVEIELPGAAAVELVLEQEAVVRGVVLALDREPAAGASVQAVQPDRRRVGAPWMEAEVDVRCDDQGRFVIDGLHGGRTVLVAEAADGTPGERLELTLVPGETRAEVVLNLQAGCVLEGEVLDRSGRPEAGLEVHVNVNESRHFESYKTDAQGRFTAPRLPAGSAGVFVETREGLALSERVELRAGATARVRLAPPAGTPVRVHGRVFAGGAPLAGAHVGAEREDSSLGGPGPRVSSRTETDAQGAYELLLPDSGRWLLSVYGYAGGMDHWSTPVDVPAAASLEFDLRIAVARLSGRVRSTDGEAIAGVCVRSEPLRHDGGTRGGSSMQTDAEGRFELVVSPGLHAVVAGGDAGPWLAAPSDWCPARVEDLNVAEGEHRSGLEFVLRKGGALAGVVRAGDGAALSWAQVFLGSGASLRPIGGSDSHGAFRIDGLEPGTHWLRATHARAASPAALSVTIRAGEETRVELALVPAVLARVRVLDADGAPLGSEVEAFDADGRAVPQHSGGEQGSVRLGPLTPGRYRVVARREDRRTERTFDVSALESEVEVVLGFE